MFGRSKTSLSTTRSNAASCVAWPISRAKDWRATSRAPGRRVFLRKGSWPIPPVFGWLQQLGGVEEAEMFRVFNMGIGFVMIVSPYFAESIQRRLEEDRIKTYDIGEVREGEPGVEFV